MPDPAATTSAARKARLALTFAEQAQKTREAVRDAGLGEHTVVWVDEAAVLLSGQNEQRALPPGNARQPDREGEEVMPDSGAETPIDQLHSHGATFHQTRPLKAAGYTTVEQVATLVAEHRTHPANSELSRVPKVSQRRIDIVVAAVDAWNGRDADTAEVGAVGERS